MTDLTLTKIQMRNAIWEGRIQDSGKSGARPDIEVRYLDSPLETVELSEGDDAGQWKIAVTIPAQAIADGVHTFLIYDAASDTKLGDFTLIAGETAADDMRAEIELLRAELDMLKRAFRRHCIETT